MKENQSSNKISDWLIYKNSQLIAFNKPPMIPVQPDKTTKKSLLTLAEIYTKSTIYLIHRIDRPASGVVLFAKTKKAIVKLNKQFQNRDIKKTYLAIVKNAPKEKEGELIHYLRKNSKINKSYTSDEPIKGYKKAILQYKTIGKSKNYHLLKIELETGRHHQIRAQLAAIGSPIKGDVKYGARRGNKDRSIHLHAWKLFFLHPITSKKVELLAELPNDVIWNVFEV